MNVAPIHFSARRFEAGRTRYKDEDQYRMMREAYQDTHALRFDRRDEMIYDIPMAKGAPFIGERSLLETDQHLRLLGKAVNHALFSWLAPRRTILRRSRPLQCWGNRKAALLSAAVLENQMEPKAGLDVWYATASTCGR